MKRLSHIAFIMDGNGRWAERRGKPRIYGHEEGAKALLRALEYVDGIKPQVASFYAFSTDNEKRPPEEIAGILGIIAYFLKHYVLAAVKERGYRVRFIGELSRLPSELLDVINEITSVSYVNKGITIVFAIGYGGDREIARAVDRIVKNRMLTLDNSPVSVDEIRGYLYTTGLPDPDIVIRFGGYGRLSNFMPLQTVYSELYFLDTLWPDFDGKQADGCVKKFYETKRNFGGIND